MILAMIIITITDPKANRRTPASNVSLTDILVRGKALLKRY